MIHRGVGRIWHSKRKQVAVGTLQRTASGGIDKTADPTRRALDNHVVGLALRSQSCSLRCRRGMCQRVTATVAELPARAALAAVCAARMRLGKSGCRFRPLRLCFAADRALGRVGLVVVDILKQACEVKLVATFSCEDRRPQRRELVQTNWTLVLLRQTHRHLVFQGWVRHFRLQCSKRLSRCCDFEHIQVAVRALQRSRRRGCHPALPRQFK
ncbi:hypothetical protein H310_04547 [Aphanomyces invadans]|uniref:Uncharacterized protein n=1 Tax=Aphanomyces invadans TaxID=157072 RepID=A0A024UEX8_9STRA|nr:hypothetical protein H310_04547 [Aphanomyces invadans]ETW04203.1 hypothetical protein H310_04547 [Aphanomyces invadans]|eukprot:XP_008867159.1 hypothetical protein H310_04547 [Aphanomyces invadans]